MDAARSTDTTRANRNRQPIADDDAVWLFGYGSLIYKVDFDYLERRQATIHGWERRFWQGSHDHRGTPEAPGRVLTLIPREGASCTGMAYRVPGRAFAHLDVREKNGYLRFETRMQFLGGDHATGLVYIAEAGNAAWLGPADDETIARQIARSSGPSGPNRDYLLRLADALRDMGVNDPHVFALEQALQHIRNRNTRTGV